jgi:hypothetical protein
MSSVGNPPLRSALTNANFTNDVWQRWFSDVARKIPSIQILFATIAPASIDANTVVRQTFTVTNLTTDDAVIVNPPDLTTGLEILNFRVSANNTLQISFWNSTGTPIDPGSQTYTILAVRQ